MPRLGWMDGVVEDLRKEEILRLSLITKCQYLGTTVTSQNCICEEKEQIELGNACHNLFQNLLSSCLLSKNIKVKITELLFCLLFCMTETWSLTLRGRG
jgi:hypothetical protein